MLVVDDLFLNKSPRAPQLRILSFRLILDIFTYIICIFSPDQAAKSKQKVDSPPSPAVSKVQKIDQRINMSPVKVTKSISEAEPLIKKDSEGRLIFPDKKDFKPNLTPMEVMQLGSFGGTYFRPIYSSVTGM